MIPDSGFLVLGLPKETMASGYEDFIFEEDLDVIMAVLEEDESLEGQFHEAVQEVRV